MKKTVIYSLVLVLSMMIFSCEKLLDVKNLSVFNPSDIWNDESLANAYLTNLYSTLPGWPSNDGNNADESTGIIGDGYVQTTNSNFKYWPYTAIRQINVLLNEIDGGSLAEEIKTPIKAQAHFLRAFHYFKAVVYHGGVPIIKVPQLLTEDLMVPRSSTLECFNFIIEDLDQAIGTLPNRYTGSNYGRIDKAAALAFKGRVLLYKASPQFNPGNPYGNAYWQDAYTATKAAKEQLESFGFGLVSNINDIFLKEQNQEAVMAVVYTNPGKTSGREACNRPLSQSKNCTGGDTPIWALVKSFPMADGTQPGSSPKYAYDDQTYWKDRDPRFYSTIVYNGCVLPLGVSPDRIQYTDGYVGAQEDGFSPTDAFRRSGFFCRKAADNSLKTPEVDLYAVDWVEIRYAEVLMNFAEAANETGKPGEALDILKQIRQRAGIEAGDGMYGITATTRDQIREAIHFENYIEFAFEGKRFWELRRTRTLVSTINGIRKYGLRPTLKAGLDPLANIKYLPSDFDYEIREPYNIGSVTNMVIPETYYFFPIHKDEIQKDPNLLQNVGWEGGTFDPTLH